MAWLFPDFPCQSRSFLRDLAVNLGDAGQLYQAVLRGIRAGCLGVDVKSLLQNSSNLVFVNSLWRRLCRAANTKRQQFSW